MIEKEENFPYVSPMLSQLSSKQIALLDQDENDGEGWDFYSNGQVMNATVFNDEISGIVREFVKDYKVKVKVNEHEVSCSCSCDSEKVVCNHVIALLYSWVYDQEEFINLGVIIKQLASLDKNVLVSVVERFLIDDPQNVKFFERQSDLEYNTVEIDNFGIES